MTGGTRRSGAGLTCAVWCEQAVVNEDASGDVKALRAQIQQMKVGGS